MRTGLSFLKGKNNQRVFHLQPEELYDFCSHPERFPDSTKKHVAECPICQRMLERYKKIL